MCLAWLQVLTVSLPGVVVLLLTTALGVVEDHVHLHGLETFSLDWGCIPIFLGYVPGALPQRRVVWMWFGAFPGAGADLVLSGKRIKEL